MNAIKGLILSHYRDAGNRILHGLFYSGIFFFTMDVLHKNFSKFLILIDMIQKNIMYVFIDASNLWQAQKVKGKFFDYEKLRKFLQKKFSSSLMEIFYYTAYPADGTRDYCLDGRHKFFTFLKKGLGFIVRKKKLKRIAVVGTEGQSIEEKGNMDVEITLDALHHFAKYDTAVFFTGDSDFLALVTYLRKGGKKVYIFSSKNNVSQELRTGSDEYFDVLEIMEDIWGRALHYRTKYHT